VRPVGVVFLAPGVQRGLQRLDVRKRAVDVQQFALETLVQAFDLPRRGRLTGQSKIILWITGVRDRVLSGAFAAYAFEAAELFFVAADPGGDGFEAAAQLVDLHAQAGQGAGILAAGAVLVDDGAQVGSPVKRGAADAGAGRDLAEGDGLSGRGELGAGGLDPGQLVVLLVSWHGPG